MSTPPENPPGQPHPGRPQNGDQQNGDRTPYGGGPNGQDPQPEKNWLVRTIIGVVVIIVLAVAAVFYVTNQQDDDPTAASTTEEPTTEEPTAEEPTAEEPTTEEPTAEEPTGESGGDVFAGELRGHVDDEVAGTGYALTDAGWSENSAGMEAGARQAIEGVYTDGTNELPITAAAFDSMSEHEAYAEELVAEYESSGAELIGEGTHYEDDTGHFWAFDNGDGTRAVVWRTGTGIVLTLSGPAGEVNTVYSAMSI
ncbi:hypothetical protein GCM10023169_11930 [Georgenia halophila]|uniref:Uncharacterized protein n=1 Tax=Georgenia halophila TaxID=620889 RepID=A0ABP8KUJ3_9MICO